MAPIYDNSLKQMVFYLVLMFLGLFNGRTQAQAKANKWLSK